MYAGPNDTASTPNGCMKWEGRSNYNGHVNGPCVPCPETPGLWRYLCTLFELVLLFCYGIVMIMVIVSLV